MGPNELFAMVAPALASNFLTPQQSPAIPSDKAIESGLGDMYDDKHFSSRGVEGVEEYEPAIVGDYDDDEWDEEYDDEGFGAMVPAEVAGEMAAGALFDGSGRERRRARRAARRERRGKKNRTELTTEVTEQSYQLSDVSKKLNAAIRVNNRQNKQIKLLHARQKESEKRVIKNKYVRALTSAAVVIPGIRAYTQNTSDAAVAFRKKLKELFAPIDDLGEISPITLTTLTEAGDFAAQKTEIENYVTPLATKVNDIITQLNTITEALSDSGIVDSITALEGVMAEHQLTNLATVIPGQWEDKQAAVVEAGAKYLFGRVNESGDKFLELSF